MMYPDTIVIPQPGKALIAEVKENEINILSSFESSFETRYDSISKIADCGTYKMKLKNI